MQERRNSSALAMGLRLSCINPSIYPVLHSNKVTVYVLLCFVVIFLSVSFTHILLSYFNAITHLNAYEATLKNKGACHIKQRNTVNMATLAWQWARDWCALFTHHLSSGKPLVKRLGISSGGFLPKQLIGHTATFSSRENPFEIRN